MQEIFVQGGYAGANVIPPEEQLPKFRGKTTCPTFNFNGHVAGAQALLSTKNIGKRYLISKDVCHGVGWTSHFNEIAVKFKKRKSKWWDMLIDAMTFYLKRHPEGKLLHDPLAACVLIDPTIVTMEQVELQKTGGNWGSRKSSTTNTFITVKVNLVKFYTVFFEETEETITSFLEEEGILYSLLDVASPRQDEEMDDDNDGDEDRTTTTTTTTTTITTTTTNTTRHQKSKGRKTGAWNQ